MRSALGLIGVLIVLVVGGYIFVQQSKSGAENGAGNPRSTIDVVGVKNDLVNLAQAERRYYAREGRYASIDDLRNARDISMARDSRGPYVYTASTSASGFRITATYNGPTGAAQSSYSIDENMEVH